jgi:HNH endonuclease
VICESFLKHGAASRDGSDRYLIMVNVDEDVLVHDDATGVCELDGGPSLAPETARRLSCDASSVVLIRRSDGTVLGSRVFLDAHHVRHRAHGGTNELDNLVELCWFHHQVVTNPAGNVIPTRRTRRGTDLGHITAALWCADQRRPSEN